MSNRFISRLPLILMAVTLMIVFYRLFLGEVLFWGLPALQFYPWREYMADMLISGQLPLWNPYNGAGAPLIANYQSALFYPLNWPQVVLPLAITMSITAVLHLFIGAWGMYRFTGRLELPVVGRGVSAFAFALSSYLVARLGTFPMVAAAVWMPWVMWAALGVLTHFRWRDVAWLALIAALQLLAGHAQTTWYSMLLVGLFSLFWWLRHTGIGQWQRLALVTGGLTLGAGIAAIQLLPTAELLLSSQRSGGVDYKFAMNFSYAPARTLNFLSPNVFGNPGDGTYITKGAFFEDAVYIGLLPLVSAFAAGFVWIRRRLRRNPETSSFFSTTPFWLGIAILAYVFALGQNSPVFPFFFRNIPTFNLFQAPVRWHIWTVFALSVLAGIGTTVWGRSKRLFSRTRLAVTGCIGAAVLAFFVAPRIIPADVAAGDGVSILIAAVVYTGIFGALAGVLTLLQPAPDNPRYSWWIFAVLVVVAVDLGWAVRLLNPTVPASFYDDMAQTETGDARAYWPDEAERHVMYETFLLFDDYRATADAWPDFRDSDLPNLNLRQQHYLLNNFDPLRVGHFVQYINLISSFPGQPGSLLSAANVASTYNNSGELDTKAWLSKRAWFAESLCWHSNERALIDAVSSENWQSHRQAHLVGNGECPLLPARANPVGEVLSLRDERNALEMDIRTDSGGFLVLADTDYPGWTAFVDGQPTPILQTNLAFRGLEIPTGAETVRFEYRPAWLLPGVLVSLASLLVMVLLFRLRNPNRLNS